MFSLIIQNNASKEIKVYDRLTDRSIDKLYLSFNVDLATEDGEYTYWLIRNDRDDVEYEFSPTPLESILHTGNGDVKLKDLEPLTGLLRVGQPQKKDVYQNNKNKTEYLYRK